ncbi:hypothetical protein ACFW04_010565 [Cataglyphis niger]
MIFSHVNQSCDRNKCIFYEKCQTEGLRQLCKLHRFKYLIQFCFVSFIISRIHANPKCHDMEILENEDMTCDIRDILDTHNRLRQSIAERDQLMLNHLLPICYWNFELASGAQNWFVWENTYLIGCGYSLYKTPNNTAYQVYLSYVVGNYSCDNSLKISDKYLNFCEICPKNNVEEICSDKRSVSVGNGLKFLNVYCNIRKDNSLI